MTTELPADRLDELGRLLRERQAQLRAELAAHRSEREAAEEERGVETNDQKDEAAVRQYAALAEAEDERGQAELRSIDAALRRMAEGRYGACVDCGEPIDFHRLLAQPAALRCAACQDAFEKRHR